MGVALTDLGLAAVIAGARVVRGMHVWRELDDR
jgi:hypothetical protein